MVSKQNGKAANGTTPHRTMVSLEGEVQIGLRPFRSCYPGQRSDHNNRKLYSGTESHSTWKCAKFRGRPSRPRPMPLSVSRLRQSAEQISISFTASDSGQITFPTVLVTKGKSETQLRCFGHPPLILRSKFRHPLDHSGNLSFHGVSKYEY
jgi:hypothetical protein